MRLKPNRFSFDEVKQLKDTERDRDRERGGERKRERERDRECDEAKHGLICTM